MYLEIQDDRFFPPQYNIWVKQIFFFIIPSNSVRYKQKIDGWIFFVEVGPLSVIQWLAYGNSLRSYRTLYKIVMSFTIE